MRVTGITLALITAFAVSARGQDTTTTPDSMPAPDAAPAPAPAPAAAPASNVTIEAVLTRGVVDRVPQDTVTAAPPDVGNLTLWTRVTGADSGAVIHHVWFRNDEQVGDVELTVGGSSWRTWSRKAIPMDWTGPWRVEVRDDAGNVLEKIEFTVG
jgi:hypothetical protein